MQSIRLSKRLEAIFRLVPPSGGVVDVGTDHGFIPLALLLSGFSGPLYATDINPGPLSSAKRLAAAHGAEDKISFLLCDGLSALEGGDISTVVIAGMGGETIASILSAAPWTREGNRLLILQPMSKADRLRGWLQENGYKVTSESLVDDGPLYELMTVSGGSGPPLSPAELLTGRFAQICADPLFPAKLDEHIAKAQRAVNGLSSSTAPDKLKNLPMYTETLYSLLKMREALSKEAGNG